MRLYPAPPAVQTQLRKLGIHFPSLKAVTHLGRIVPVPANNREAHKLLSRAASLKMSARELLTVWELAYQEEAI